MNIFTSVDITSFEWKTDMPYGFTILILYDSYCILSGVSFSTKYKRF